MLPSKPKRALSRRIRLGAVGYLNAKPLVYGLEQGLGRDRFQLEFEPPSLCASRLASGELDLSLLPSIEYARCPGYSAIPGICIAADGPAASVLLFSRVPRDQIRSVAVDASSRTSVALLRILFREHWNADPQFTSEPPNLREMLSRHDAGMMIGDQALFAAASARSAPGEVETSDLGTEWKRLTGLPFVFAFWAGPGGVAGTEEVDVLNKSLTRGLAHLPDIASRYRWEGVTRPEISLPYLQNNIRYRWGQSERDGLLRFFLLAGRHGLLDEVPEMTYFGEPVNSGVIG
jgi:chorismate dehydratase